MSRGRLPKGSQSWLPQGSFVLMFIAGAEVLIMMSPFAGMFYATFGFGGFLSVLARSPYTAWLNGFFLPHATVSASQLLNLNRELGLYLLAAGSLGFVASSLLVYSGKIAGGRIARGMLYRYIRHPQYLCLGIAGWGLLTTWPRILLLGVWVTMLFLYSGLARIEERKMVTQFGKEYLGFSECRGSFLPGSPAHRVFEMTFGRIRPRSLGWILSYFTCLAFAFAGASQVRSYSLKHTSILDLPSHNLRVVSVWPQSAEEAERVIDIALQEVDVRRRLEQDDSAGPWLATVLPPKYPMRGMYYKRGPALLESHASVAGLAFDPLYRALAMGIRPRPGDRVEIVFSRAVKGFDNELTLGEVFDASVLLIPVVVVGVVSIRHEAVDVLYPQAGNAWGPDIVMPVF